VERAQHRGRLRFQEVCNIAHQASSYMSVSGSGHNSCLPNSPIPLLFRSDSNDCSIIPNYAFATPRCCGLPMLSGRFSPGEATEREKSMMYLTVLGQNRHGVSWTSGIASSATLNGNERKHSVQVTTMYGTPFESFPLRGIQTGADCC
jgi:hypothetical protein